MMLYAHRMRGFREGGTILSVGLAPMLGHGTPPTSVTPAHRACRSAVLGCPPGWWLGEEMFRSGGLEHDALWQHAVGGIAPQPDQQLARQRHNQGPADAALGAGGPLAVPPGQR